MIMAMDPTPWMVGGGAEHTVELARLLPYMETSGQEGVAEPGDLKVTPLDTPGGGVAIAPGAVAIKNTNPGGSQQMYLGRNGSTDTVDVQASSSSSGRADMVAVVVRDPQYPGTSVPDDPKAARYIDIEVIQGVPANARTAADAGVTVPAYPLARINLPSSTGTVQLEHITDLRRVAKPQSDLHMHAFDMPADTHLSVHTGSTVWPDLSTHTAYVPEFATRAKVIAEWMQLHAHREAGANAPAHGTARIGLTLGSETIYTQSTHWNTSGEQNFERFGIALADTIFIPEHFRGRDVTVQFFATKYPGPNAYVDSNSSTSLLMFFEQAAV